MKELVFLLEESSAQAMLEGVLPRMLPVDVSVRCICFEGKQDLEKRLEKKIRGYLNPSAKFIVIRDQDSYSNCVALKKRLSDLCVQGGKPDAMIRIACRELESFYLADLAAVENGLGITGLAKLQQGSKYRSPDYLGSPSRELSGLTRGRYQKRSGSKAIGPWLDLDNDRSRSFRNLIRGIREIVSAFDG